MTTDPNALPLVVTESAFDQTLISALLQARGVRGFALLSGNGPDDALTLARGERLEHNVAVLLVVDADTDDMERAQARSEDLTDLLRMGRATSPAWAVCAVPALEVVLFKNPRWLRSLFPEVDSRSIEFGVDSPTSELRRIAGRGWKDTLASALRRADPTDLAEMSRDPLLDDIATFVTRTTEFTPRALAAPRAGFGV